MLMEKEERLLDRFLEWGDEREDSIGKFICTMLLCGQMIFAVAIFVFAK